jgi:hypothetical protein
MRRFLLATAALAALWALAVFTPARAQSSDPGPRSAASSDTDVVRDKSPVIKTAKKAKPPARVVRRPPPPPPPPPYPPPAYGYYAGPPGPYWGGYPYWRRPYWGPYAYGPYYRPYYRPFPFLPFIW